MNLEINNVTSFLYLTDSSRFAGSSVPSFIKFELLIPITCFEGSEIRGSEIDLWVAEVRHGSAILLSNIQVDEISTTDTSGYILIIGNVASSTCYRRIGSEPDGYEVGGLLGIPDGGVISDKLIKLKTSNVTDLNNLVKSRWKVSLKATNTDKLDKLYRSYEELDMKQLLDPYLATCLVKSNFSESELYKSQRDPDWMSPSISLAVDLCQKAGVRFEDEAFLNFTTRGKSRIGHVPMRMISTDLREFVASDFQTRKFMWPCIDASPFNFFDALRKTERAEGRHQEILKDCYEFLISKNFKPLMNVNVDLAYEAFSGFYIFEIKSANVFNFRDQVLKGFVQVLEYTHTFQGAGHKVSGSAVIVEAPYEDCDIAYYESLLSRHGVRLVVYDSKLDWPSRCNILGL